MGDLATTTKLMRWLTWGELPFNPSRIEVQEVQGSFMAGPNM